MGLRLYLVMLLSAERLFRMLGVRDEWEEGQLRPRWMDCLLLVQMIVSAKAEAHCPNVRDINGRN